MDIFLGEPSANIKQWIIDHATPPGPAGHADTRFTLQGGTVETANITGTLDRDWMIDNGYWDEENTEWIKPITQADIGNTVMYIDFFAFAQCSGLTSVTIGNSVTDLGEGAFYGCSGLTSVAIPDNVTYIGNNAFSDCSGLASVTIPDSVTSIDDQAFYGCGGLTSVTIVATGKPGASAASVKDMMIAAGVSSNITWNMPS